MCVCVLVKNWRKETKQQSQVVDAPALYLYDPIVRYPKGNSLFRMSVSAILFRSYKDFSLY